MSDGTLTYTWKHGRQLSDVDLTDRTGDYWGVDYYYDANGLRAKKTVGARYFRINETTGNKYMYKSTAQTHIYTYSGGMLMADVVTTRVTESGVGTTTTAEYLDFAYDASGTPTVFTYNDTPYYYVTNAQGDVMALVDTSGNIVVQYSYDPWGNVLSVTGTLADTIGQLNPLRYRSYVYDTETGLYYLQSRYYDPEVGRFLNADGLVSTGQGMLGNNMFAYCLNNPVNMSDETGNRSKLLNKLVKNIEDYLGSSFKTSAEKVAQAWKEFEFANFVTRGHYTTPTMMLDLGYLGGKVGFSTTTTTQDKPNGLFYAFSDYGESSSFGGGINVLDCLGVSAGVSTDLNVFANAQVTPWVHGGVSVGLDGVGAVVGFDHGYTSYDFEIKAGMGWVPMIAMGIFSGGFVYVPMFAIV